MRALDNEPQSEADETCAVGRVRSLDSHPKSDPQASTCAQRVGYGEEVGTLPLRDIRQASPSQ